MSTSSNKTVHGDSNVTPEWPPAIKAAFAAALAFVLPKDAPVLELSSGNGEIESELRQRGFSVVVANVLSEHASAQKSPKMKAQAVTLPFPDATFGSLFTTETAWVMADPRTVIEACRSALKPGGLFVYGTGDEIATDIANHMEVGWETILKRNRLELTRRAEVRPSTKLADELRNAGATEESFAVARWSEAYSPRNRLDWTKERKPPTNVGAEVFGRCLKDYERWLK